MGANTMTPSLPQLAPRGSGALHRISGAPPVMETFLSFLSAKKPSWRLSGDQKGSAAHSVPSIGRAASDRSCLSQSRVVPTESAAVNTSIVPFGETARARALGIKVVLGGAITEKRADRGEVGLPTTRRREMAMAMRSTTDAAARVTRLDRVDRLGVFFPLSQTRVRLSAS